MKKRSKRGTLSISIGAIVIIVIAFVVLGLGLVLTKTIFQRATSEIPEIFDIAKLGKEPTAESPLTVRGEISIKRKATKELDVGYYNTDRESHLNVSIGIKNCLSVATGEDVSGTDAPIVVSREQEAPNSEPIPYLIFLKEKGLDTGEYICEIVAMTKGDTEDEVYERVQVSLIVTS